MMRCGRTPCSGGSSKRASSETMRSGPSSLSSSSCALREGAARRSVRLMIALLRAIDGLVRLLDEARKPLRMPMIAPGLPALAVHALLHHGPLAVVGDEEAVQIKIEAVLHRGAVDLRDQPAGARQRRAVEANALAERGQLRRRPPRLVAASAADMQPKLVRKRPEPALQRADHAGGDAGRMPIHAHHGA